MIVSLSPLPSISPRDLRVQPDGISLREGLQDQALRFPQPVAPVIDEVGPQEEVAARAGYEANGGGFNNALGRLRTLELLQGRGELRASDNLFECPAA